MKDPAGNVVSVVAQNLKKGTTEVTFPFTVVPEKIAAGTWTVEGKSFEIVSNDASFANLVSNIGTWDQPFNPTADKQEYEVLVDADAKAVDFTPTAAEGTTITMSYTADDKKINSVVQNGKANTVTLGKEAAAAAAEEEGQTVTFTVIAPDQKTSATYTVTIKQAAANANDDATLSKLAVGANTGTNDIFNITSNVKDSYSAIVPFATNAVTVTPTAAEGATVYIDGKQVVSATEATVNLAVGQNKIEVKVVAEDNKTEKVYTINVERTEEGAAKVNTLNSLTLSDGTLEGFTADSAKDAEKLTTKVGNKVEDLTITPIATHGKAKIEVTAKHNDSTDLEVVQDGASYTIKGLKEDSENVVTIKVTPANGGAAQTYTLTVERAKATASDIAQLSEFKAVYDTNTDLFGKDDFKPTTEEYSYNVKNGVDKLKLTPTASEGGEIYINGEKLADGTTDKDVDLKIGENIIKVKVVAEDAVTERTYTLKVNRASSTASDVATLNDIVLSDNAKLEGFTADKGVDVNTAISTTVGSDVNELTITPKATDAKANVTVTAEGENLEVVKNGGSYTIKGLKASENKVKISVQAENVGTPVDYTLTINKVAVSASDNAFLADTEGIKLTALDTAGATATAIADYKKDKYDYTAPVAFAKVSTKLEVEKADTKAKVTVNGKAYDATAEHALKVGDNKFTIVVTAADGKTTKTYTVNVKRAAETASDVATLNKLDVSAGTLEGFTADKGVVSDGSATNNALSVKVANDVKDLTLTPKATEAGATIEVTAQGKDKKDLEVVASNGAYTVKGLAEGDNKVTVKVTAANGVATESYEVTVNRVGAGADNDAKLKSLVFKEGTTEATKNVELKATNDAKTEYVTYVTNETAKVTFTATVVDGQSVLYDGEVLELNEQAATVAADLVPGQANEVKFTVLAADQKTTVDYKVIVHRAAADASADATLKAIESVSPGEIKDFDPATPNYDVIVPKDTKVFKFKPVVNEANARVEVTSEGNKVTKNADGTYSVNFETAPTAEAAGTVTVKVTAADNSSTQTYTLTAKTETP